METKIFDLLREYKRASSSGTYFLLHIIESNDSLPGDNNYIVRVQVISRPVAANKLSSASVKNVNTSLYTSIDKPIPLSGNEIEFTRHLQKVANTWNDEEFINLYIGLCKCKRTGKDPEFQDQVQYLEEVKKIFEAWYCANGTVPPDLYNYILYLRRQINELIKSRRQIKSEILILDKEIEILEKQFENDITDFPAGLNKVLQAKEDEKKKKLKMIAAIEMQFWGVYGKSEGLYWKHSKYVDEYKKINLDDDELYNKLLDKSTDRQYREIEQEIKKVLAANNIPFSGSELNDLCLNTLKHFATEEIIYGEKEENLSSAIIEIIKSRYNLKNDKIDELLTEGNGKKEVPSRGLIYICIEAYKNILNEGTLSVQDKESKLNRTVSSRVIEKIEKEYILNERNKSSISDYFRKGLIIAKKNNNGEIIIKKY
ncbi:MAG: hypothetical protein WCA84_13025 [Ignavibacteriaceae bacterium]